MNPELPILLPSELRSLRSLRRHPRLIPEEDYLVLNRLGLAVRDYAVLPGGGRTYAEECSITRQGRLYLHTRRQSGMDFWKKTLVQFGLGFVSGVGSTLLAAWLKGIL